ncbi:MAG: hypothetical protein AW07_01389 [Candidatus Accumulibacter sp. SK-11]|nr:MAG: hypothetical protein AW07_01389 [Candidatus Accumulibacter sp. SK-11]
MTEGQHLAVATQPRLHQLPQDCFAPRRSVTAAVHDAQAALAGELRIGDELRDLCMRLLPVQPVQVDVVLNAPAAPTQVAQHAARHAATQEGVGATEIEPVIDRQRAMQQFAEHRRFVDLALPRLRTRLWPIEADAIKLAQRPRPVHSGEERRQVLGAVVAALTHRLPRC